MTAPLLHLVMPMAGRGSRFKRQGFDCPKPLVPLAGKPFFAWSVESVTSKVAVGELVFVVLREHVADFAIDREIGARFPAARVLVIDDVTAGAAETAAVGAAALPPGEAFAVNDCDHAFDATGLDRLLPRLAAGGDRAGALLGFRAASPNFSYVKFDADGRVVGTVEKQVASPFAIAGCYLFGSRAAFEVPLAAYRRSCAYDELFMSGVYDTLIADGGSVDFHELASHVPFGTPEEMARVDALALSAAVRPGAAR